VAIVKRGKWEFITQAQEERDRAIMRRHTEAEPEATPKMFHASGRSRGIVVVILLVPHFLQKREAQPKAATPA
jgi:hypothetical protein